MDVPVHIESIIESPRAGIAYPSLVAFLYLLMRDEVAVGVVKRIINDHLEHFAVDSDIDDDLVNIAERIAGILT